MQIMAVLDDAPVELLRPWLAEWGAQYGVRCQEVARGAIHRAQCEGWRVDLQLAALSPTRCELHILWSESEPTERVLRTWGAVTAVEHWQALQIDRPLATEYVAEMFGAIQKRWRCTNVLRTTEQPEGIASAQPSVAPRPGARQLSRAIICRKWWELRDKDDADPSWAAVARAFGISPRALLDYRRGLRGETAIPDPPPRL
jgi:hypothetical protein